MARIFVIGIGYKPLDLRSRERIYTSDAILASARLYDVFSRYEEFAAIKSKIKIINNISETMDYIKDALNGDRLMTIALLSSGDPMFFGIGRRVLQDFGKNECEILPDMSSMQLAFARIKQSWDDALMISLHGGPDANRRRKLEYTLGDLPKLVLEHSKIGVLTDRINSPSAIAQRLASSCNAELMSDVSMYVCEKIGYPDEKITNGTPSEIAQHAFSDPNVVIIANKSAVQGSSGRTLINGPVAFGLTEDELAHSRGLITKDEVRATVLHRLKLPFSGVLWDIGAGSGSVSIEAARLCPGLKVFSVEKEDGQIANMLLNLERYGPANVEIIKGTAPEALSQLPAPDRVFIGGSGGRMDAIIMHCAKLMAAGIIVINATTLETFTCASVALKENGYSVEATQISISRMKPLGEGHFFSAQNPVFVLRGVR
ncbi:MAG TPA: precorrin-6y C5,15-methyltransferase (decarboxylating) subunit CbiE [Dissulfurispiraceae bacterium]|nr:precorrin-6y C5,15-methyltransferase (decarboxylating) subunit CbiE [Dissulfurispiraceae bacterium]